MVYDPQFCSSCCCGVNTHLTHLGPPVVWVGNTHHSHSSGWEQKTSLTQLANPGILFSPAVENHMWTLSLTSVDGTQFTHTHKDLTSSSHEVLAAHIHSGKNVTARRRLWEDIMRKYEKSGQTVVIRHRAQPVNHTDKPYFTHKHTFYIFFSVTPLCPSCFLIIPCGTEKGPSTQSYSLCKTNTSKLKKRFEWRS